MPTLDIPERQLLVDFFNGPNGFRWHHRVLLLHVRDTTWVVCTPDLSVQGLDVATHRLVMLSRNSPFPADRVAETYACDPADFSDVVLARLRREAAAMAEIGAIVPGVQPAAPAAAVWRISDMSHSLFGEVVPAAAVADANVFVVASGLLSYAWMTPGLMLLLRLMVILASNPSDAGSSRARAATSGYLQKRLTMTVGGTCLSLLRLLFLVSFSCLSGLWMGLEQSKNSSWPSGQQDTQGFLSTIMTGSETALWPKNLQCAESTSFFWSSCAPLWNSTRSTPAASQVLSYWSAESTKSKSLLIATLGSQTSRDSKPWSRPPPRVQGQSTFPPCRNVSVSTRNPKPLSSSRCIKDT